MSKCKFILLLAFIICLNHVYSQKLTDHYLFPEFETAAILYKSGEKRNTELNYNTLTEEMVFIGNNQFYALDMTETIDTVFLGKRCFVPNENYFLEFFSSEPLPFFIRHKNKFLSTGSSTGYGTSQTSAIDNYSHIISTGKVYGLTISGDFELAPEHSWLIKKDNTFYTANNLRQLGDIFDLKRKEIRNIVNSNDIDLNDLDDMIKLLTILNDN